MRKKLMSYVLAAVLTASLAVTAFAVKVGDNRGSNGPTNTGQLNTGGAMTYAPTPESDGMIKGIVGRINAVYNYTDGILVTMMDQNRGVTVFDAGRVRATFGYNSNGTYTMTNFFVYGTDKKMIDSMAGSNIIEKMANYLTSVGMSSKQLEGAWQGVTTIGGVEANVTDPDNRIQVAWLADVYNALSSGINYSASINLTAQYGATATISINGQAQYTLSHSGTVIESYNYSNTGFLKSIETLEIAYDSLADDEELGKLINSANAKDDFNKNTGRKPGDDGYKKKTKEEQEAQDGQSNGVVIMKKSKSITYMDPFGRASYVMKEVADKDDNKSLVTTQRFQYSTQGSLNSVTDLTTNQTTVYAYGRPSHTINGAGALVSKNDYAANGMLNGVDKYNDGVIVSRDVFNYGKYLMSVDVTFGALGAEGTDLSKYPQGSNSVNKVDDIGTYSWDALRMIYKELTENTAAYCGMNAAIANKENPSKSDVDAIDAELAKFDAKLKMYGITNLALYAEHRSNSLLLRAMGLDPTYEKVRLQKKMDDLRAQIEQYKAEAAAALSKATGKSIADARQAIQDALDAYAEAEANWKYGKQQWENDSTNTESQEYKDYKKAYENWLKNPVGPAPTHPGESVFGKQPVFELESFGLKNPTEEQQKAMNEVRQIIYSKLSKAEKAQQELNNLTSHRSWTDADGNVQESSLARWEEEVASVQIARQRLEYNNGYSAIASVAISVNNYVEQESDVNPNSIHRVVGQDASEGVEGWTDGFTATITDTKTAVQTISFNITINDNGGASMGIEGAKREVKTLLESKDRQIGEGSTRIPALPVPTNSDPVAEGDNQGLFGADGQTLVGLDGKPMTGTPEEIAALIAKMSDDEIRTLLANNGGEIFLKIGGKNVLINVMDKQGFQAAEGEEIFVGISDVNAIRKLAAGFGDRVMAMGDVTADRVDGKLTMTMNLDYGGGFEIGQEAIDKTKDIINIVENGGTYTGDYDTGWISKNLKQNEWLIKAAEMLGTKLTYEQSWRLLEANNASGGLLAVVAGNQFIPEFLRKVFVTAVMKF